MVLGNFSTGAGAVGACIHSSLLSCVGMNGWPAFLCHFQQYNRHISTVEVVNERLCANIIPFMVYL